MIIGKAAGIDGITMLLKACGFDFFHIISIRLSGFLGFLALQGFLF
jgi:hypothetical protein